MILKSLKWRIILSSMGIVILALMISTLYIKAKVTTELSETLENNAVNLLNTTKIHIESQYNAILYYKQLIKDRRKTELKNYIDIIYNFINTTYKKVKAGEISETEAKQTVLKYINEMNYANNTGYFWVNNTDKPYPKMIMHRTMPELNGQVLDDPKFNCAMGKNKNLFIAMVEVCEKKGQGYVEYLWPKPTDTGLTEEMPKISFVKLFEPWNWVIGTGVYIDDIHSETKKQFNNLVANLNKIINTSMIAENGYYFIFNEENFMLVHPNLAGKSGDHLINPGTNNKIMNDIKDAYYNNHKVMEYLWDKIDDRENYIYPKKLFIRKFDPLGWYICASVYKNDFEKKVKNITNAILIFSGLFLIITLIVSMIISQNMVKPLNQLINSLKKTNRDGLPTRLKPKNKLVEITTLSNTINSMLKSIKISQDKLKYIKNYLLAVIDSMPSILIGINNEGKITQWNIQAEKYAGLSKEQALGKHLNEIFTDNEFKFDLVQESIETKTPRTILKQCFIKDGQKNYKDLMIFPLLADNLKDAVIRIDDITEQMKLEQMMIHSEKMLSLGNMAAGIAHEINNPLAGIIQNASVLKNRLTKKIPVNLEVAAETGIDMDNLQRYLEKRQLFTKIDYIQESVQRVAKIVSNMIHFSGKANHHPEFVFLPDLMLQTIDLIQNDHNFKTQFDFQKMDINIETEDHFPKISCESSKIQQVFLNILKNSLEAFFGLGINRNYEKPESRLQFTIQFFTRDQQIMITIQDNGPGIEKEILPKIFEPFFTTKFNKKNLGLGLSVSYYIIKNEYQGEIYVKSELNNGTTFTIELPKEMKF